jgi:hypothetical protein
LVAFKDNKKVLEGVRSKSGGGLWDIPIPLPSPKTPPLSIPTPKTHQHSPSLNIILRTDKKSTDLAAYHHAAMFSPTTDTFVKAIDKNYFLGWPGLTSKLIRKHLPPTVATESGHLRQEKHGLRSTKTPTTAAAANISETDDFFPIFNPQYKKTNDVCYTMFSTTDKAFMDFT